MTSSVTAAHGLSEQAIEEFATRLRGELIRPDDTSYDVVRHVYNGMIDKRPALIARCHDVADVMAAVNFGRDNEMLIAVRGGGHNVPGFGTCDDGLVIDLTPMKGIRVDPVGRTMRVEGGCILSDLDHATHAFGLAVPTGVVATTGIGGLTLGGGLGHLTRKHGLAIDNLVEVDVVLADGRFVTANAETHADLFWAVRGGGGNFGVVTAFLFRTHPVNTVYAGPMLWPFDQAAEVLRWYGDFLPNAPDDLNGTFAILTVPAVEPFPPDLHDKTMCAVTWCYTGPLEQAQATFAPIRSRFGGPALDWVGEMPFPALQGIFDPIYPPGLQWYWKAHLARELTSESIAEHVQHTAQMPAGPSIMLLHPVDGAASRVANDATAWSYREARWAVMIAGVSSVPADMPFHTAWVRSYWDALLPHSLGGSYVNFLGDEGDDRVAASYRGNYERLVKVKDRYDPDNVFRVNQNIRPSSLTG